MKTKPIKIDLNKLANNIATSDNPDGINLTTAHTKATLATLGAYLREECTIEETFAVVTAIVERAGLK